MLKPIKNKKEHQVALNRIYQLMQKDLKAKSVEFNELEILSILVENYEDKIFPIEIPDPVEAIKFKLEQLNMDSSILVSILGSKSRASEILNRKRKLSISMIRALHSKLKIPASSLIG